MSRKRSRGNSEGSIYPVPGGWRAYAWVTGPDGIRRRKYIKAVTYEDAQRAWLKLRAQADRGPVASNVPTLHEYLAYWLSEVVRPNLAPKTYEFYELLARLYIDPYLGRKRLDKLTAPDVRRWLNQIRRVCQCCAQGKTPAEPRNAAVAARSATAAANSHPHAQSQTSGPPCAPL